MTQDLIEAHIEVDQSTKESSAQGAALFVELCDKTTMQVSVGSYGVKFKGTESQVEEGWKIAKEFGYTK